MRRQRNAYRLLALAGVLSAVAWGCSTDSPTAPRQENPVPPGPGQTYFISIDADPGGIVISETAPTGTENTTLLVEVRVGGSGGPRPADGTTALVTTSLGSFVSGSVVRTAGVSLVNGHAFLTLFSGGTPVQLGIATVQATLHESQGEVDVPISVLEAAFNPANPENNLSVHFMDTSLGNPTTFHWNFGDGDMSNKQNPIHVYAGPGTYSVTLTVTKKIGHATLSSTATEDVTVADEVMPP
jgi:PKD repeat protein